jgi:hypothetical protein
MARLIPYVVIVGVCVLAAANLWWGPGIIQTHAGGDSPFLLQRTFELVTNLRAGIFPARWMPDAAYGLGYPFFNFYASLPYYLAALLNLIGFDLLTAIKLAQTLGMLAAALSMWLYARTLFPKMGALLAVVAYTLAPYHLVNLYVRGDSLQEFWAFVWYPLILWAVDRVVQADGEGRQRWDWLIRMLGLAMLLAGFVLTHNVSTLIFAPFIVLYTLVRLAQWARAYKAAPRQIVLTLTWLAGAAVLGAALSAWFWLPALGEAGLVQLNDQTTGYFDFNNHFRSPAQNLIQANLIFDYHVDPALNAFAMALPQAVLMVLGAAAWLWRTRKRSTALLVVALALLSTVLMTPLSKPVWDALPALALTQFPWRFLSVQALFGALLIGGLACAPITARLWQGACLVAGAALLLTLPALPNERLDIRAENVTPRSLQLYEWFSGNIGTTIRAEYLPRSVRPRPMVGPDLLQQPRRALVVDGRVATSALALQSPTRQVWRIQVSSDVATMTLPLLYWPGWQAALLSDGRTTPLALSPYIGSGWAMFSLPRGDHQVQLSYDGTPLEQAADRLSLVALAVWVMTVGAALALSHVSMRRIVQVALRSGGAIAVLVLLGQGARLLTPVIAPPIQRMEYTDRQFPNRAGLTFRAADGQTYELTSAMITPTQVQPGGAFTLTTTWRDGRAPALVGVQQEMPSGGYFAYIFYYARRESYGPPALSTHQVMSEALPGPLLLKVLARDAAGQPLTATTSTGQALERTFLSNLDVVGTPATASTSTSAPIRTFPNGIELRSLDWYQPTDHDVCFRPTWASTRPLATAWQALLLLRGEDGRDVAHVDTQPQAGLAPTWSWPLGVSMLDSHCVPTNNPLRPGEPYTLLVRWYRVADQRAAGEVTLLGKRDVVAVNAPNAPRPVITAHTFTTPAEQQARTQVRYGSEDGGAIRLLGHQVVTTSQTLNLTLTWSAAATLTQDYKQFVHLAALTNAEPVRQSDGFTLGGRYPTGMWLPGELVTDTVTLDLAGLPAGRYQLAVGWYDPDTLQRLPATTPNGALPEGRFVLAEINH